MSRGSKKFCFLASRSTRGLSSGNPEDFRSNNIARIPRDTVQKNNTLTQKMTDNPSQKNLFGETTFFTAKLRLSDTKDIYVTEQSEIDSKLFSADIIEFPDDIDKAIDEQVSNEVRGYITLKNILPEKFELSINKDPEISELYDTWVNNITQRMNLKPFRHRKLLVYSGVFGLLSNEEISKIIVEKALDFLLVNAAGLPVTTVIMAFGYLCIKRARIYKFEKMGGFNALKVVQSEFLENISSEDVGSYTQLWKRIAKNRNCSFLFKSFVQPTTKHTACLGAYLCETFIAAAPLFRGCRLLTYTLERNQQRLKSHVAYIKPIKESVNYFRSLLYDKDTFKINTHEIPSLVPCIPVYKFNRGGYYANVGTPIIRGLVHRDAIRVNSFRCNRGKQKLLMDNLSASGLIGWCINVPILETMTTLFKKNTEKPDLYLYSYAMLPDDVAFFMRKLLSSVDYKHISPKNLVVNYQIKKELKKACIENYSLWANLHKNIVVANYLKNRPFFIPYNLDFRGRFYPIPTVAHYYSSDNFRSLLMFSRKVPLGVDGLFWLKVHLGNKHGSFKSLNVYRVVEEIDKILDDVALAAEDPLKNTWWMQTSEPWQALATCIEINAALKSGDPQSYMCGMPVHQDGTCNGLQHYSAMSQNPLEADHVHLRQRFTFIDLYSSVSRAVQLMCIGRARQSDDQLSVIAGVVVDRKIIKQTVMTYTYGVTPYGAGRQLEAKIQEIPPFNLPQHRELGWSLSKYIGRLVLKIIASGFRSAGFLMRCLKNSTRAFTSHGLPVTWNTRLNLLVVQPYLKRQSSPVISRLGEHWVRNEIATPKSGNGLHTVKSLDLYRQRSAFPPNFVHSLDATHMVYTQDSCFKNGVTFAAVHDSYWAHPANIRFLRVSLRNQFIRLHDQKVLDDYISQVERITGVAVKDHFPKKGTLNIESVKDSVNFFS